MGGRRPFQPGTEERVLIELSVALGWPLDEIKKLTIQETITYMEVLNSG